MLVGRFGREEVRRGEAMALEIAGLKRDLAAAEVRCHHETMVAAAIKLELESAKDSLNTVRAMHASLKRVVSMEKRAGREMMLENGVLKGEIARFEEVVGRQAEMLEARRREIDGLGEKVVALEAALQASKDSAPDERRIREEMRGELREEIEKDVQEKIEQQVREQMEAVQNQSKDSEERVLSLVKKGGFASEKELVQFIKSRDAQERLVERLERRLREMEDAKNEEILLRKETEKIVRQQKKAISALEKRLARADGGSVEEVDDTRKNKAAMKKKTAKSAGDVETGPAQKRAKMVTRTVEVDAEGTEEVSVWNPDAAKVEHEDARREADRGEGGKESQLCNEPGDSHHESHQETAERVDGDVVRGIIRGVGGNDMSDEDADKENPKQASGHHMAKSKTTSAASAGTAGSKRRLMSIPAQGRSSLLQGGAGRGPLMLGVTRKTGFRIPSLNVPQNQQDASNAENNLSRDA